MGDLDHVASLRNRREFQNVRDSELRGTVLGIFFQEIGEYRARFRSVFLEETLLIFLDAVRRSRRVRSGPLKAR